MSSTTISETVNCKEIHHLTFLIFRNFCAFYCTWYMHAWYLPKFRAITTQQSKDSLIYKLNKEFSKFKTTEVYLPCLQVSHSQVCMGTDFILLLMLVSDCHFEKPLPNFGIFTSLISNFQRNILRNKFLTSKFILWMILKLQSQFSHDIILSALFY